eukprot:6212383-Pleurochrysis_carterae.AAC.2
MPGVISLASVSRRAFWDTQPLRKCYWRTRAPAIICTTPLLSRNTDGTAYTVTAAATVWPVCNAGRLRSCALLVFLRGRERTALCASTAESELQNCRC